MKNILIVDDEDYLRVLLEQTLEDLLEENVQLHTASDGRQGLEMVKTIQPDLVFLDIMMPHLSGFEVLKEMHALPGSRQPVVILLTARGQETDRETGLRLGAKDYVTKPFDPDEILALARRELQL